uniref:Uncharacterized protein n=1 Tax=Panagrolaimus superbus TaxID=310955 RepID=A0A914Z7W5_9BILA
MYNDQFSGYPFQQQQQQQPCQTYPMLPQYNFGEYVEPYHQNGQMPQQQQPFHEHLQQQYPMYQQPPPQIQQNPMHGIFQQQQYPPLQQHYPLLLQIEPTPMLERLPDIPRITQELSKNLDPEYSKELDVLYILLSNATTKEEKETVFCGFEKKFLILPFLWQYRLQLISQSFVIQAISDAEKQVTKKALYDFYSIDTFSRYQKSFKCFDKTFLSDWRRSTWDKNHFGQLYDYVVKAKEGLFFPHENLIDVFKFYEAYSDKILLQRDYIKYKKALQQCHRIISATSLRELFCYFTQIDDPKVVIQNVELLIAQNPTCQWLWKSYLQFLRDRQPKLYYCIPGCRVLYVLLVI